VHLQAASTALHSMLCPDLAGISIKSGFAMLVDNKMQMAVVVACVRVDEQLGLLVKAGAQIERRRSSSKWQLGEAIEYLDVSQHQLEAASFWRYLNHDTLQLLH